MSQSTFTSERGEAFGEAGAGGGLNFDYKRLLRLRVPLMLIVAAVCAIPMVVAAWLLTTPYFVASAELRFLSTEPRILYEQETWAGSYDSFVATQMAMIGGPTILSRVADDPQVRALDFVQQSSDPVAAISQDVQVRKRGRSELVTVTYSRPDRDAAITVLEEIVTEYRTYATAQEAEAGGTRLELLTRERNAREAELDMLMRQITQMRTEMGPGRSEADAQVYLEKILETEDQVYSLEGRIANLNSIVAEVEELVAAFGKDPNMEIVGFGIEERVQADEQLSQLRQQAVLAEAQMQSSGLREEAPQRVSMKRELDVLRSSIAKAEQSARGAAVKGVRRQLQAELFSAEQNLRDAKARLEDLRSQRAGFETRAEQEEAKLNDLREMEARAGDTRRRLEAVTSTIQEINLESNAPARVRVESEPRVPSKPSQGRRYKMAGLALFAALGLGFAVGVLREITDQQLRSTQDLANISRFPIIAAIPHTHEEGISRDTQAGFVVAEYPNSRTSEEYRNLVARVIYPTSSTQELSSIAVLGASRADGKTTVACNLAIALAQAGRRVLLLDLSSKRPAVERAFGFSPGPGMAEILLGDRTSANIVHETPFETLHVIGPGLNRSALAGKLASRDMMEFLREAEDEYEHIVIDTPPFLLMSESRLVAPLADGVIFVASAGVSTLGMVRRSLRELQEAEVAVVGLVLNKLRRMRGGYLGETMRKYKDYADEEPATIDQVVDMEAVEEDEDLEVAMVPVDEDDSTKRG